MVANEHEIELLENEFRSSVKQYRSMVRWGIDKILAEPANETQNLLLETRRLLDQSKTANARNHLEQVVNNLRVMEYSYPEQKEKLLLRINNLITSLEHHISFGLPIQHESGITHASLLEDLERARLAVQSDDYSQASQMAFRTTQRYLSSRQAKIAQSKKTPLSLETIDLAINKINTLKSSGTLCKSLKLEEVNGVFKMSEQRRIKSLRYAVVGSPTFIEKIFSPLVKNVDVLTKTPNNHDEAALLRISVSRDTVIYVVGIALTPSFTIESVSKIFENYSAIVIEDTDGDTQNLEQKFIYCLEHAQLNSLLAVGDKISERLDGSQLESIKQLSHAALDDPNTNKVIDWLIQKTNQAQAF